MHPLPAAAPFYADLAKGPEGGGAFWLQTMDDRRIRVAHWPRRHASGTVLILPGRTEYVEKYGLAAALFASHGYETLAIDWRGQGLSDRPLPDPNIGHVNDFFEYQLDLAAVTAYLRQIGATEPYFMMAHSMGGAIGLRALIEAQTPFKAAVFSAPMWGIQMPFWLRPVAQGVSTAAFLLRQEHRLVPSLPAQNYVSVSPFFGNALTGDSQMWDLMRGQVTAQPTLGLAGPSLGWLKAALRECDALATRKSPTIPALTALGSCERVVEHSAIHRRMKAWPQGKLALFDGAQHEVPMERAHHRQRFYDLATALFAANR